MTALPAVMLRVLSFVLPVLIPSWRFFKSIEPSPRVEWAAAVKPYKWQDFRPRPARVSPYAMLWRLIWNPARNEDLFLVSCAERIAEQPTEHAIGWIQGRIQADVAMGRLEVQAEALLFRLVFVRRGEEGLVREVLIVSDPFPAHPP